MNLTAYKKIVEKRLNRMCCLIAIFLLVMVVVPRFFDFPEDDPRNFVTGMLAGMSIGGSLVALFITMKQAKALKDENLLRQLYIEEHDERQRMIRQKAGDPMVKYLSLCLVVAGMFCCVFNIGITIALTAAAIFQLLVSVIVKFICCKTM